MTNKKQIIKANRNKRKNNNITKIEETNKSFTPNEKKISNFYEGLNNMKNSTKPQIILDIIRTHDKKPIVEVELFGRKILALIDSGAETSVINTSSIRSYDPTRGYLTAIISSPVTATSVDGYYTEVRLKLGGVSFFQRVCIAPMDDPDVFSMILGYDILTRQEALIDTKNNKIRFAIDPIAHKNVLPLRKTTCNYLKNNTKAEELREIHSLIQVDKIKLTQKQELDFNKLIENFQDILIEDVTKMVGADLEPYAPVFKSNTPIYQRQYRIPHSLYTPLRKKLDKFEAAGIIQKGTSQWNSPVLAVRKPDGVDVRMVLDLRKVNGVIEPLPYPLMRIEDIINRLGGSKVFSNLDLNNGYFNVKLADHVKERFAFSTPWGRYIMNRLPQGCVTSASVFQRVMNDALHELIGKGNVFVFQDDVIVHTATVDEHIAVLEELFTALKKINLALRPTKCVFFKDTIKFLGHKISAVGSEPSVENIMAIRKFERPKTVRQVRSFLGTVNFYRKFIPNITTIAAPLYELIKKDQTKIVWSEDCNKAFVLLKEALISAPVLAYPDFSYPFIIKADSSNVGVGGVLEQEINGEVHPIAYCSRKLNKAERNYSTIEKEALAIVYVLSQFRYLIYGFPIILRTDHKPLTYVFQLKESNQRLVRWLLHIQDYNLFIEHIKGSLNCVADMLSRSDEEPEPISVNATASKHDAITNDRIRKAQEADPDCLVLINNVKNNVYKEKEYILDEHGLLLRLIVPTRAHSWRHRIVLPLALRDDVMFHYHDRVYSGHLSASKVIWKVKLIFTWETMFRDISSYVQSCERCQKRNVIRTKAPFQPISPPSYPFERLNIDLLGPFSKTKSGFKYVITYTDSLTRFVIANPLPNIEASTVAADYMKNVFSHYGGSREILSDKGSQFTSTIFQSLCKRLGTKHLMTSSYRPSCNGLAERNNQKILRILAQVCNRYYSDWDEKLPLVLLAIRTSHNRSTMETPFFLMHGFDAVDPLIEPSHTYRETHSNIPDFVERYVTSIEECRALVAENLTVSSEANCKSRNDGRKLREFNVGEQVLFQDMASYAGKNRKLRPRYKGPYRIIARLGLVNYRIRSVADSRDVKTSHVDKLKNYFPRYILNDVDEDDRASNQENSSDVAQEEASNNLVDQDDEEFYYLALPSIPPEAPLDVQPTGEDDDQDMPEIVERVRQFELIDLSEPEPIVVSAPMAPDPVPTVGVPPSLPVMAGPPAENIVTPSLDNVHNQIEVITPPIVFPSTSTDVVVPPTVESEQVPSTSSVTDVPPPRRERYNQFYTFRERTAPPKYLDNYKL